MQSLPVAVATLRTLLKTQRLTVDGDLSIVRVHMVTEQLVTHP